MKQRYDFEDIRPLYDEEVHEVMQSLLEEPAMRSFLGYIAPEISFEEFKPTLLSFKSKNDFQRKFVAPFLEKLAQKTASNLDLSGQEKLSKTESYTYISNHRDIVLDPAFLNVALLRDGFDTAEVAIGDNLLVFPWIRNLVRMNKSFIVKRNMPVRQLLEASRRLSTYIHFALKIKGQSVWISQREGRSKDSTDRTQEGLIKMLAMGGGKDIVRSILSMNIVPTAISYEYDPCDFLKAKEYQQKRDDAHYVKSKQDDLINMQTGLTGYKGNIHFQVSDEFNAELTKINFDEVEKTAVVPMIAQCLDRLIHKNLRLYSGNYVAYDLLYPGDTYAAQYTADEKQKFENYLNGQILKVDLENRDDAFIRTKILEMYSNPVINYMKANA